MCDEHPGIGVRGSGTIPTLFGADFGQMSVEPGRESGAKPGVERNAGPARSPVLETRFAYREPLTEKYPNLAGVSEELVRCIKCGMCRAVCPTLIETVSESQGARGRVSLVEAVFDGRLTLSDIFDDRISTCLNCKACIQACPSGVRVDGIILAARAELVSRGRLPFVKRLILRGLLKRGRLLPPVGKMASLMQRALLALSPKGSALRLLLPAVRISRERHLPVFAARSFTERVSGRVGPHAGVGPGSTAATGPEPQASIVAGDTRPVASKKPQLKVAYFVGCSANLIYTSIAFSVMDVLSSLGVEVFVTKEQGCCGLPVLNAGDFVTARGMARKNVEMLRTLVDRERLDAIVVSCSSCGLSLKREYSSVLGIDTSGLSERVMDISEFIVRKVGLERFGALLEASSVLRQPAGEVAGTLPPAAASATTAGRAAVPGTGGLNVAVAETGEAPHELVVTYHDPCHLRRGQGIKDEPRQIISILPGIKFIEMREPDRCCGGAGLYSFTQYEMSKAIAAHKVRAIVETGASVVLTGCASCIMQIQDALRQAGCSHRVTHVIEFVSERLRGETVKGSAALPAGSASCSKKH